MFHKIKSVAPLSEFRLLVCFTGGEAKQYDVAALFTKFGEFQSFLSSPGLFEQVRVDPGGYGISWNDELDIDGGELWENGQDVLTPFNRLLSFSDATTRWGLNESTLRKAVSYHKLVEGLDVQKFGKQWVVTLDAMEREYGPAPL